MSRIKTTKGEGYKEESERLKELRKEFEAYRASVPVAGRRRFPKELRKKVLAAVEERIPIKAVLKACQITSTQIKCWQEDRGLTRSQVKEPVVPAKILDVVPKQPIQNVDHEAERLEIRIGRWNLQLRLEKANSCNG